MKKKFKMEDIQKFAHSSSTNKEMHINTFTHLSLVYLNCPGFHSSFFEYLKNSFDP